MQRLLTFLLALAALAVTAVPARADGFISPYVGVNFGGDTTDRSTLFGGSIGFLGHRAGFEFDVGYTPDFFGNDTFDVDGKLTTMMGNLLIGGRRSGFSPYFAVGGGLIRTNITVFDDVFDLESTKNSWGGNVGAGFFAGGDAFTLRGDVRYFRAFDFDGGVDLDVFDDTLGFWRATVGVGLMW